MSGKTLINLDREQKKEILNLALILFTITAITALALSFVNAMTSSRIAQQRQLAVEQAMSTVLPAESYEKLDIDALELDTVVGEVYVAKDASDAALGHCVKVSPLGFGGEIQVVVGVDNENKVTGVDIVAMSETPGLGTKAKNAEFLNQFSDKTGVIKVVTGEASAEDNEVSAITGATVTSKAVAAGIQAALDSANKIKGGVNDAK